MQNILTNLLRQKTLQPPTHVKSCTQRRNQTLTARLGRETVRELHSRFAWVGPVGVCSFRRPLMATSPHVSASETRLQLRDAFDESLCKLKALELLLKTDTIHSALDDEAAAGIGFLFNDVIRDFESVQAAL